VEHQGIPLGFGLQTMNFEEHDRMISSGKFGVQ
jgi:hypothetical protein